MYVILFALLAGSGALLAARGVTMRQKGLVAAGVSLVVATLLFFVLLSLWAEVLWFEALGFGQRFWLFLGAQVLLPMLGAAAGFAGVYLLNAPLRRVRPAFAWWPETVGGAVCAFYAHSGWEEILLFLNRVDGGVREPMLNMDVGFFLFTLPVLEMLQGILAVIVLVAAACALLALYWRDPGNVSDLGKPAVRDEAQRRHLLLNAFALAIVTSFSLLLDVFHLLYSEWGVVTGPGWTDVYVRMPGYFVLALAIPLIIGLLFAERVRDWSAGLLKPLAGIPSATLRATATAWLAVAAAWLLIAGVIPWITQQLVVEPNEITREKPFIVNNIEFTRRGFDLQDSEERQFPASEVLTRETIRRNEHLISEIRLWDWQALDAVYKQFQEIRLYYEFKDVDIDRYHIGDRYRQIMVSARELAQQNLPAESQTFVNRHFKYTHGYGLTLTTVSDFTPSGLPDLLVRDIPPVAEYPALEVTRPEIYYGELTSNAVVVNTEEAEFDYPSGEQNVYVRYAGDGGVPLENFWRKFVFGWNFGGTSLLFSGYPRADSRVMLHRQVRDRARHIAPFLEFENDPYIVLAEGRLYWIIDAYTTSHRYPYSTRYRARSFASTGFDDSLASTFAFNGQNYVRNAVKVVVDAYNGDVDFYVFEGDDPLVRAWQNVLPGFFLAGDDMPPALRRHVRYPQAMLLTQGLVYASYHMQDPVVFYNQEDLWVRATEKHYGSVQPVEPYYVMWELPGSDEAEFVLMLPFTPKNRQVMIGWIAGLSDGDNYGRFLTYKFPKEKRVLGPQQVETKIDQDRFLSGQLTLWDQRGSNVLRGNVLAIPLDDTVLYVEPIFLQAETAAYPELRIVVVMHGDDLSYGESFEEALEGLFRAGTPAAGDPAALSATQLAKDAADALQRYLEATGDERFQDAARALGDLQDILRQMQSPGGD